MRTLLILLITFALCFASSSNSKKEDSENSNSNSQEDGVDSDVTSSCTYTSSDSQTFDLSPLSRYTFEHTDKFNNTWYWAVCRNISGTEECDPAAAVCIIPAGVTKGINAGKRSTAIWSDYVSKNGISGIEIIIGDGDPCLSGMKHKTHMVFLCDSTAFSAVQPKVVEVFTDGCFSEIEVKTAFACPEEEMVEPQVHSHFGSFFLFMFVVLVVLFCCVCTCARCCRRRQCQKKNRTDIPLSSVSYEPVPQEPKAVEQVKSDPQRLPFPVPVQQIPTFYSPPPLQSQAAVQIQPPQYYLYPIVQQPGQYQPAQVNVNARHESTSSDEQLARQLQAQFDKE